MTFSLPEMTGEILAHAEAYRATLTHDDRPTPLVVPRADVDDFVIRDGTFDDVPFMDALQRKHTREVGWMPTKQFQGKIGRKEVLVAEAGGVPVGYLIGQDRYFKRDDLGIIYQINVVPEYRRKFVAAALLRALFRRGAWGCRLYCCWCAQDIKANRFWEAMGFTPLAFRTGSDRKFSGGRVHIFWQKRVDEASRTPWWFPSMTAGGSLREDRIVLPIPPGVHWSEVHPVVLPTIPVMEAGDVGEVAEEPVAPIRKVAVRAEPEPAAHVFTGGSPLAWIVHRPSHVPEAVRKPRVRRRRRVHDPVVEDAARELRDRFVDVVKEFPSLGGKYDLTLPWDDQKPVYPELTLEAA